MYGKILRKLKEERIEKPQKPSPQAPQGDVNGACAPSLLAPGGLHDKGGYLCRSSGQAMHPFQVSQKLLDEIRS